MNRKTRRALAEATVHILSEGHYRNAAGDDVHIAEPLAASVRGTVLYTPERRPEAASGDGRETKVEVCNETTLAGGRALFEAGERVAALNFASAMNPGGGFLSGAEAQEESLARASGLYRTLQGSPFYAFHRQQNDARYSDRAIYSPDVPVFRSDSGRLLDAPWACSFVTAAAVNRRASPIAPSEAQALMTVRTRFVLDVMAAHGHRAVVLGAWGCGVFLNDSVTIAKGFRTALETTHHGVFDHVRFSVLDLPEGPTYEAFAGVFAAQ